MAYALAILVIWTILFTPVGLLVQRALLGRTAFASVDLALAPVTGLAIAVIALSILSTAHVGVGHTAVQVAVVVVAVLSGLALNRLGTPLRAGQLGWALLALLFAVIVIQIPVWQTAGSGPLAWATTHEPVLQTAEVRVVAQNGAAHSQLDLAARHALRQGYSGFAQLAGFTVGLGDSQDTAWSAFGLLSLITAVFAALTVLPIYVLTRVRQMRPLPSLVACTLGTLSPLALLGTGLVEGPGLAALPLSVTAVVFGLRAGTDRGRWALATVCGAGVLCIGGPLALVPIAAMALGWLGAQSVPLPVVSRPTDPPLLRPWKVVVAGIGGAVVAGLAGAADGLVHLRGLPWDVLYRTLDGSLRAWPLTWIGSSLDAHAVTGTAELLCGAIGLVLALIALGVAVRRRDRVDVALVGGAAVGVVIALVVASVRQITGQQLLEDGWLVAAPLLTVACIHVMASVRRPAPRGVPARRTRVRRLGVQVVELIGVVFVLLTLAASIASGGRFTHTPVIPAVEHLSTPAVSLDESRWTAYALPAFGVDADGGRVADVDELTGPRALPSERADGMGARRIITDENPLASDPPSIYSPSGTLFGDPVWDSRLLDSTSAAAVVKPLRHDPVEGQLIGPPPAGPLVAGGLVTPPLVDGCGSAAGGSAGARTSIVGCAGGVPSSGVCNQIPGVETPLAGQLAEKPSTTPASSAGSVVASPQGAPSGVACWTVPLDARAKYLIVHVREIGYVLDAAAARPSGKQWHQTRLDGQAAWTTDQLGATLHYEVPSFGPCILAQFQADVSGGAELAGEGPLAQAGGSSCTEASASTPETGRDVSSTSRTWTNIAAIGTGNGTFAIRDSSGTRLTVARAVVRTDPENAESCDVPLALDSSAGTLAPGAPGADVVEDALSGGSYEVAVQAVAGAGANRQLVLVLRSFTPAKPVDQKFPGAVPDYRFLADWTEQYRHDPAAASDTSQDGTRTCAGSSAADSGTSSTASPVTG